MNPRQRDDTVLPPSMQQARKECLPVDLEEVNRIQHDAIIHDFENQQVHLCDLNSCWPGPYRFDRDRQCASTRFMAPEASKRGATIDERTTAFTLGRAAFVFLSEGQRGETNVHLWRGSRARMTWLASRPSSIRRTGRVGRRHAQSAAASAESSGAPLAGKQRPFAPAAARGATRSGAAVGVGLPASTATGTNCTPRARGAGRRNHRRHPACAARARNEPPAELLHPARGRLWEHLESVPGIDSVCEWKGAAHYFNVNAGVRCASRAAWSYPDPTPAFVALKDHVAFYAGQMDACYVDDEQPQPQPGGFYGGWVTADVVGPFKGDRGTEGW